MIAARQIFLGRGAGGGWTNPYVTDGLVAMWDGEWNAGGGVHDGSATTWADLSGNGYDGTLAAAQLGIAYSWESNAFVRYNMGANGMWTPIDISDRMLSAAQSATFSVQIVTGAPVGSDSWTSQIFNLARTATEGWSNGITAFRRNEVNGQCSSFGGPLYGTSESFTVTPNDATSSVSLVLLGATIALYDGTRLVGNKVASITPDATIAGVFARLGSSNYAYRGRYMRYAIYNRALTAAEVAANYAIDKARFNLT